MAAEHNIDREIELINKLSKRTPNVAIGTEARKHH